MPWAISCMLCDYLDAIPRRFLDLSTSHNGVCILVTFDLLAISHELIRRERIEKYSFDVISVAPLQTTSITYISHYRVQLGVRLSPVG